MSGTWCPAFQDQGASQDQKRCSWWYRAVGEQIASQDEDKVPVPGPAPDDVLESLPVPGPGLDHDQASPAPETFSEPPPVPVLRLGPQPDLMV